MQAEDEEERFDETLDEIVSCVPDPEASLDASASHERSGFGSHTPATQHQSSSSQEAFDPQLYRAVMDDSLFRLSRKICGLDDTRANTRDTSYISREESDQSDEDFLLDF